MNTSRLLKKLGAMAFSAAIAVTAGTSTFAASDETIIDSNGTTAEDDYSDVEVNFAKALQLSLYFYDANKCGTGITGGNLEWRGDCHTEDATIPLKPMGEDKKRYKSVR